MGNGDAPNYVVTGTALVQHFKEVHRETGPSREKGPLGLGDDSLSEADPGKREHLTLVHPR